MAYYLVRHENKVYANAELYYTAIAGGERSFMKMLANGTAVGVPVFDQILYLTTKEQQRRCEEYSPQTQDTEGALGSISPVGDGFEGRTITISKLFVPPLVRYRGLSFMRIRDFNYSEKYRVLPQLASVRVGSRSYVALDAVNTAAEKPIVVTVGK
jgi:hypothetical protein